MGRFSRMYREGVALEEAYGEGPAALEHVVRGRGEPVPGAPDTSKLHEAARLLAGAAKGGLVRAKEHLDGDTPVACYCRLCEHLQVDVEGGGAAAVVEPYLQLEAALGYSFAHRTPAPPHPDAGSPFLLTAMDRRLPEAPRPREEVYQRLEFYGDSILETAVREKLVENCSSDQSVGTLNDRKRPLVANDGVLPQVGEALDLGRIIRFADGQPHEMKEKMYADAMEALLGAVHFDFKYSGRLGAEALCSHLSKALVWRLWRPYFDFSGAPPVCPQGAGCKGRQAADDVPTDGGVLSPRPGGAPLRQHVSDGEAAAPDHPAGEADLKRPAPAQPSADSPEVHATNPCGAGSGLEVRVGTGDTHGASVDVEEVVVYGCDVLLEHDPLAAAARYTAGSPEVHAPPPQATNTRGAESGLEVRVGTGDTHGAVVQGCDIPLEQDPPAAGAQHSARLVEERNEVVVCEESIAPVHQHQAVQRGGGGEVAPASTAITDGARGGAIVVPRAKLPAPARVCPGARPPPTDRAPPLRGPVTASRAAPAACKCGRSHKQPPFIQPPPRPKPILEYKTLEDLFQ